MNPVIPLVMAAVATWTPACQRDFGNPQKGFSLFTANPLLIAQQYGGKDPHGEDPHGDDPRDEQHDPGLPANKENKAQKAPKNVYGPDTKNDQSPYP